MRRRRSDQGSVQVLEAVVVVSVMVSAIAFVVTFEEPPNSTSSVRGGLEQAADDALALLYDTPVDSRFGDDALSAFIAECLNLECTNLSERLDRLVPEGGAYALYVSNGVDTYPVYVMGEPSGEAVSATQQFEPAWSSTFVATATDMVGPNDALLTYELPVFNSNVVTPGGSQLLVKMFGSRSDGSDYVLTAAYATTAQDADDPVATAASLTFVDAGGNAMAVHDPHAAIGAPFEVDLRLAASQGAIPAGVEVTVDLPRGWTGYADAPANDGWTILANATDANGGAVGSAIRASLNASLSGGSKDLRLMLTYHGDVLDLYPLQAQLSHGAFATASLIVRGEAHAERPPYATPIVSASVAAPMGNGEGDTTWTLGAYVPVDPSSLTDEWTGGGSVRVDRVEIAEADGNAIFDLDQPVGGWSSSGTALTWYAPQDTFLDQDHLLNLSFPVHASGVAGPSEIRAAFVPPVTFDAWSGKLVSRTGWGFHRDAILPADDTYHGYNASMVGGETAYSKEHRVNTSATYRSTPLPGAATYNVSNVDAVEEALYGSYVEVRDRSVPVGGEVVVEANVQSVLFALAKAGQQAGVTLRFYPPWSAGAHDAWFSEESLDEGVLSGDTSHIVLLDVDADGFPDPIVGTTNGRVVAFSGLTGQRLQGNSFTAPLSAAAERQNTVPRITALTTTRLHGEDFIVVGTDHNSNGVYVLAKDLSLAWYYNFTVGDVLAIDAATSIADDAEPEIVVTRSQDHENSALKNALTFVFAADERAPGASLELRPIEPAVGVVGEQGAFFSSLGWPSTVLSVPHAGPAGATPGILVPVQTTVDPGLTLNPNPQPSAPGVPADPTSMDDPTNAFVTRGALSTPRAGLQAMDEDGTMTSTLFGAPAGVLRAYDHGGDAVDDVVMGGASGFVVLANGTVLTQPLYSYLLTGSTSIISADSPTSASSYTLSDTGSVVLTDDAWVTMWGPSTSAAFGKAISSNRTNEFWVVGAFNAMYRSFWPLDSAGSHVMPTRDLVAVSPTLWNDPTYFALHTHEFRDVWFRGDTGWVVGTKDASCIVGCAGIVMNTTNGGVTWNMLNASDFTDGHLPVVDLNRVKFMPDGTGWIVGNDGAVYRRLANGDGRWETLDIRDPVAPTTRELRDIACDPGDLDRCIAVGTDGLVVNLTGARGASPHRTDITGMWGLPTGRDLYSVGFQRSDRLYMGSTNMVLASFGGANWTAVPLNYVKNAAYVVNALGDGTGFVYGGNTTNARIWLLHDYATHSQAETTPFALPPGSVIQSVSVAETNVSLAQQEVKLGWSADDGATWHDMGALASTEDARDARVVAGAVSVSANDIRFRISLNTSGDKTVLSPHVRMLAFDVALQGDPTPERITIDFTTRDAMDPDPARTNADWNLTIGALRQPLVQEYWVRNVSGQVFDMDASYDVVGDAHKDVYVATGDILSENSPDYVIYAQEDVTAVVAPNDRVYLLDGANGNPLHASAQLAGEVRAIRIAADAQGEPARVFATTWDEATLEGRLYALDPITLETEWDLEIEAETPQALEIGESASDHPVAFIGTERAAADPSAVGKLYAYDTVLQETAWEIIPDDLGKYQIVSDVGPNWLFGPYVVEVEVTWQEQVTGDEVPVDVIRSARFYDHFMVTPPDALTPPVPVYTAKLLVWMKDWG